MRLEQGQIWRKGRDYYRVVERERLSVVYKLIEDLETREGTTHKVTKKEFCRLIKGAELLPPARTEDRQKPARVDAVHEPV